jgi:hypothetical protein
MFDRLKSWASNEYAQLKGHVSADVHEFLDWAEGRNHEIEAATSTLVQFGYTVIPPAQPATASPATVLLGAFHAEAAPEVVPAANPEPPAVNPSPSVVTG